MELDIIGMMFDATDDLRYGFSSFPHLFFSDGTLSSFNYIIAADFDGALIKLRDSQIVGNQALFSSVPKTGTALLTLLGLGLLAYRHRQ